MEDREEAAKKTLGNTGALKQLPCRKTGTGEPRDDNQAERPLLSRDPGSRA
jgi:hypothetical protein